MKISENALTNMVIGFLAQDGGSVFAEVASLGQSADLVLLRDSDVMFVEVKVNATRRAIDQCKAHELVADYICIATAAKTISPHNFEMLERLGYGLISCQVDANKCTWMVRPRKLNKHWAPIRNKVVERMTVGVRDAT